MPRTRELAASFMPGYGRLWPGARAADRGHRASPGISASAVIAGVAVMAEAELRPSGPTRTGLAWRIRPTWRIRYALGYQRLRIGRILHVKRGIFQLAAYAWNS